MAIMSLPHSIELQQPRPERIRRAVPDDLPALAELVDASMRGLSEGYSRRQIESALLFITQIDPRLITDGTFFVAEAGNMIAGAGGWTRRPLRLGVGRHEHAASYQRWLDHNHDAAIIRSVFVHPAWARRGIGRRMLALCERAAQHADFEKVALVATLGGTSLYQACGYSSSQPVELVLPDLTILPVLPMSKTVGASS